MTKVNMSGWTQEQIDNWQDPMSAPQQGPKTGIAGISPLPGLINQHYNPLDMGKYEGNPNDDPTYTAFMQSEFNKPVAGGQAMTEVFYGDGKSKMFGDTGSAGQFRQYLESMGIPINQGNNLIESVGPGLGDDNGFITRPGFPSKPGTGIMPLPDMSLQPLPGPELKQLPMPEIPDYTEKFSGYDTKIGGFDNQFKDIVSRLDKLEQGIGSMANTDVPAPTPVQGGVPSVYTGNNARGY